MPHEEWFCAEPNKSTLLYCNISNIKAGNENKRNLIPVPGDWSHLALNNKGKTKEETQKKGIKHLHRNL